MRHTSRAGRVAHAKVQALAQRPEQSGQVVTACEANPAVVREPAAEGGRDLGAIGHVGKPASGQQIVPQGFEPVAANRTYSSPEVVAHDPLHVWQRIDVPITEARPSRVSPA